jgi:hypothetical protein
MNLDFETNNFPKTLSSGTLLHETRRLTKTSLLSLGSKYRISEGLKHKGCTVDHVAKV